MIFKALSGKISFKAVMGVVLASSMVGISAYTLAKDKPATLAQDKPALRFKGDGTFKVVMFSDLQGPLPVNQKSIDGMNRILDKEKPDFVMLGGDQVEGSIKTVAELKKYIDIIVKPMESRKIPWAHVFGNHDEETGISAAEQEKIYEAYPYCLSQKGETDVDGIGNYVLPVKASIGNDVAFNLWALDSHKYLLPNNFYEGNLLTDAILNKNLQGSSLYDFIKFSQVMWYYNKSTAMEKMYGHKIQGLMFFHIPIPEFRMVSMNPQQTGMTGEKNEEECNSPINSGLFSVVLQRGDVKGIFCGHDHINDYVGTYCGIKLGYDGSMGYSAYGLKEKDKDRLRGARVFLINEKNPSDFKTWIRFAEEK